MAERAWSEIDESLGERDRHGVAHAQIRHVSDAFQLGAYGRVDLGNAVPEEVAPEGTRSIEVAFALHVRQPAAFGMIDDQAIVFSHLRERMPYGRPIELGQFIMRVWVHRAGARD